MVLIAATVLSYPIGLALRQPWLLPLLNALPAYIVLVHRLRKGERGGAVRAMLWWAVALAILGTLAFTFWPQPLDAVVVNGPEYKAEMLHWIKTGQGREGSPRLFLPQHILHLAAFVDRGRPAVPGRERVRAQAALAEHLPLLPALQAVTPLLQITEAAARLLQHLSSAGELLNAL